MTIQFMSGLNTKQIQNIEQKLSEFKDDKFYTYPWIEIEDELRGKKLQEFTFVGYGSILNFDSLAMTFNNLPHDSCKPVIAFGVQRIFNYDMPNNDRYGPARNQLNRAALNVRYTGNIENSINGILVRLPLNYISNLRHREIGYDLIPVICTDWFNINSSLIKTFILRCPDEVREGQIRTNNNLMPHLKYYKICRDGAQSWGDEFLYFWLNTTYLADGITPVAKWEIEKH